MSDDDDDWRPTGRPTGHPQWKPSMHTRDHDVQTLFSNALK